MTAEGGHRVLITGIAGHLAGRLAARLHADERVSHVAGVDVVEPADDLEGVEVLRADQRAPLVAKVVEAVRPDTIVHLALTATPGVVGGRSRMKERNVIGTMQLLAAAQGATGVRKLILRSTTAVYGSSYDAPSLIREDTAPAGDVSDGYAKDAAEVEGYTRAFARRRPDAVTTILRLANLMGATVDSPLTRYLSLPLVPIALGYDPRLQFCHEDDAVEVLRQAVLGEHPGTFNVAGPGVVYLSQALRLAGRPAVPVPAPFASATAALLRRSGLVDFSPDQLRFLLFGRVADVGRLREAFGYAPRHSTREALEEFVAARGSGPLGGDTLMRLERRLAEAVVGDGPGSRTVGNRR